MRKAFQCHEAITIKYKVCCPGGEYQLCASWHNYSCLIVIHAWFWLSSWLIIRDNLFIRLHIFVFIPNKVKRYCFSIIILYGRNKTLKQCNKNVCNTNKCQTQNSWSVKCISLFVVKKMLILVTIIFAQNVDAVLQHFFLIWDLYNFPRGAYKITWIMNNDFTFLLLWNAFWYVIWSLNK